MLCTITTGFGTWRGGHREAQISWPFVIVIREGFRYTACQKGEDMPATLLQSAAHWLARAKEARVMAEQITVPVAKQAMLDIAEDYEKVAKRAAAREASIAVPPHEQ